MIYDRGSVLVVPFPFVDRARSKRRPALVISAQSFNKSGHTILAMITTKVHGTWPGDVLIDDLESAGLHAPCLVRLKVFTLDNRLIQMKLGVLADGDRRHVMKALRAVLD